jgi:hypothetical protein
MALSANSEVPVHNVVGDLLTYKCGASVVIYKGGFVGIDPAGFAKPFVVGDRFIGIAYEEVTAATATATAGTAYVRVYWEGVFDYLFAASQYDIGDPVYATDDGTLSQVGHPDAFVGRVIEYVSATVMKIQLRHTGEMPQTGEGSILKCLRDDDFVDTRLTAGDVDVAGASTCRLESGYKGDIIGATTGSLLRLAVAGGGYSLGFGATAEVQTVAIYQPSAIFLVSGGITFEVEINVVTEVDADAADGDLDFGLGTALTVNSMASMDHGDMVDLAAFHYNSLATQDLNIYAQWDNNVTDVAATNDSLVNLVVGTYKRYKLIVRPSGLLEFWINNVRAAPTIAPAAASVRTTALMAPFINWEKAANDSLGVIYARKLRVAGAATTPIP